MKILVRNLARSTTEEELQELFARFGTIQSCNLVMDPVTAVSKGFGFLEMPKAGEAKAAIKTLNGSNIAGSTIRVKKAEDKTEQAADPAPRPAKPAPAPKPTVEKPGASLYRRKK